VSGVTAVTFELPEQKQILSVLGGSVFSHVLMPAALTRVEVVSFSVRGLTPAVLTICPSYAAACSSLFLICLGRDVK
jgi:hypothetical protein